MTFLELYGTRLHTQLGTNDTTQLFTTALRKEAINDGMYEFVRQTGCTKRYGPILVSDATAEYSLLDELPTFIKLAGAPSVKIVNGSSTRYIQGARDFRRTSPEELDRLEPGWRNGTAGAPTGWYINDSSGQQLLGIVPTPDFSLNDVWTLSVPYIAKPDTMVADNDQPFTVNSSVITSLEFYQKAIVHFAAAQLEPLRKNVSGVERQMQLYTGYVAHYLRDERSAGQDQITVLRDYYGEGRRSARGEDPHR